MNIPNGKYTEEAVTDSQQALVLHLGGWVTD